MKRLGIFCMAAVLLWSCWVFPAAGEVEVAAKGAILMEAATGTVLFEQDAHTQLPPASVTKVMTLLLVMEAIDAGQLDWEDPVTASETAQAKGGSQIYLKAGETMTVRELLKAVAVSSANDAACALAEHLAGTEAAFVERMNRRAEELGMQDSHFVNCTGLDDGADAASHYTSAYDIALMSRQLLVYHPDIREYTTIWMDTVRDGSFGLANTNKLVRFYTGCTGLKTGYTSKAGFCLSASAEREGMELIAVVLGCESSAQRFAACKSLLDQGFAGYALITPEPENAGTVAVELGVRGQVDAVLSGKNALLIQKAQKNSVTFQTELAERVTAPVSQGQRLGTLTVRSGQQILAQLPLVAQETVPRLRFSQIFLRLLKSLCFRNPA